MRAVVTVMLKDGVLDPQGKAIGHALHSLGFDILGQARGGRRARGSTGRSADGCGSERRRPTVRAGGRPLRLRADPIGRVAGPAPCWAVPGGFRGLRERC